jgi:hypothetical protein
VKRRSPRERLVFAFVGACAANFGVACEPLAFQTLEKLTPIAVEVSPPTANPGDRVALDLTLFDPKARGADTTSGDAGVSGEDELRIAWFGGCHNPPGESATGCLPLLADAAATGVDLLEGGDPSEVEPALLSQLGFGSHFEMDIPDASIASRQRRPDLIPFGVSYAFFGVCRGTFTLVPEERERLPIGCVDEDENPVSEDDFLIGFTTVYVYDELESEPPPVRGVALDGERVRRRECSIDADCDGLGERLRYACHEAVCLPRVPACQGACESLSLAPIVNAEVGELDPTSVRIGDPPKHELVWVKYYALGALDRTESLVMDRDGSLRAGFAAQWTPPRSRGAVPLWTVVQDSRGGTTPVRVDVLVD